MIWEVAIVIAAGAYATPRILDLLAHVSRYRRQRRIYPAAERGHAWTVTRR